MTWVRSELMAMYGRQLEDAIETDAGMEHLRTILFYIGNNKRLIRRLLIISLKNIV